MKISVQFHVGILKRKRRAYVVNTTFTAKPGFQGHGLGFSSSVEITSPTRQERKKFESQKGHLESSFAIYPPTYRPTHHHH